LAIRVISAIVVYITMIYAHTMLCCIVYNVVILCMFCCYYYNEGGVGEATVWELCCNYYYYILYDQNIDTIKITKVWIYYM